VHHNALAYCFLQQCVRAPECCTSLLFITTMCNFFISNIFVQQNYLSYCVDNKEFLHYNVLTYEFLQ